MSNLSELQLHDPVRQDHLEAIHDLLEAAKAFTRTHIEQDPGADDHWLMYVPKQDLEALEAAIKKAKA